MATRHERMTDKATNDRHAKILKALMLLPENRTCADCKRRDPRWASHSLGCFVCLRCSGVHRSLGVHISKMKSADLDSWTPDQLQNMIDWGNARVNYYWEARATFEPNDSNIELFIRCKYERRQFVREGKLPDPKTLPIGSRYDPATGTVTSAESTAAAAASTPAATAAPAPAQPAGFSAFADFAAAPASTATTATTASAASGNLLNFGSSPTKPVTTPTTAAASKPASNSNPNAAILDLFATSPPKPATTATATAPVASDFGAFGSFSSAPTTTTSTTTASNANAFGNFGAFTSSTTSPTPQPTTMAVAAPSNDLFGAFPSTHTAAPAPAQPAAPAPAPAGYSAFGDFGAFSSRTTTSGGSFVAASAPATSNSGGGGGSFTPAMMMGMDMGSTPSPGADQQQQVQGQGQGTTPMALGMGGQPAAAPAEVKKADPFDALGVFSAFK